MLTGILYMYMKLVVLDGYTENPGDLDWRGMEALGDLTVYARSLAGKGKNAGCRCRDYQ